MLFYSKQSKSIRGANVIYSRVTSQVDKPPIYNGYSFTLILNLYMKFVLAVVIGIKPVVSKYVNLSVVIPFWFLYNN